MPAPTPMSYPVPSSRPKKPAPSPTPIGDPVPPPPSKRQQQFGPAQNPRHSSHSSREYQEELMKYWMHPVSIPETEVAPTLSKPSP